MLALDFPLYGFKSEQCLDGSVLQGHHLLLPNSVETSQTEHRENKTFMRFSNLIVGRLARGFHNFYQRFRFIYNCPKNYWQPI